MSQLLNNRVECIKGKLEKQFLTRLVARPDSTDCHPDLFKLSTLFNVIKALADFEKSEILSAGSYMNRGVITLVAGDVHPTGKAQGATMELLGLGMALTVTISSKINETSIWNDKYTGASLNGEYWPHAIDQLPAHRKLVSTSQLIAATTRIPDRDMARELRRNGIEIVYSSESMGEQYFDVLRSKLGDGIRG